jgi:hypothetical protein
MFTWLTARVMGWTGRARAERELDEELRDHVERETQSNLERGLPPGEARRAALRDLGGIDQTREAVRDERAGPADWLLRDLTHAARALGRSPGFTATIIATLAIGIGGTTLVFSVVEALVIRALPYADPDHLVVVASPVDWSVYELFRSDTTSFAALAAYVERGANVTVDGESSRLGIAAVSRTFLDVVGVRPAIGRTFSKDVLSQQGERVALLSDRFWRTRFSAARDIVGRTITIDRVAYTVVGTGPSRFSCARQPPTRPHSPSLSPR